MTSSRKRRRQVQRLTDGPARSFPWVRTSRYAADHRVERQEFGSIESFRFIVSPSIVSLMETAKESA